MRPRRLVLAVGGLILIGAFVLIWVYPVVAGPSVDCGGAEPAVCEALWREAVDITTRDGVEALFPVTSVEVRESAPGCWSTRVDRWIYAYITKFGCH